MTFEQANQFGEDVKIRYKDLGYRVIAVPMSGSVAKAELIIQTIMKNTEMHDLSSGKTLPDCLPVLEGLKQCKLIFHRRKYGSSREAPSKQSVRDDALKVFLARYMHQLTDEFETGNWATKDFCCQKIAIHSYLLAYPLIKGIRVTRRATIWRYENEAWKIAYHKGTIVEKLP